MKEPRSLPSVVTSATFCQHQGRKLKIRIKSTKRPTIRIKSTIRKVARASESTHAHGCLLSQGRTMTRQGELVPLLIGIDRTVQVSGVGRTKIYQLIAS